MKAFIEITDANGYPGYIRADVIEGALREPETGITRVFVSSNGYYRVQDSREEIVAKLRDIQLIHDLEGRN